jgi:putative nucleotidyltransferase with HDIG domain
MFGWTKKARIRRKQVRLQRAKSDATLRGGNGRRLTSWTVLTSLVFIVAAAAISLLGEAGLEYSIGQQIDDPVYARVTFQVPDPARTAANQRAARASTPSYYKLSAKALTVDRIRSDLKRLYQAAADANTLEEYTQALEADGWPAETRAYQYLRGKVDLPGDAGRADFERKVDDLPLEDEYVARGVFREPRDPPSTVDFILLEVAGPEGEVTSKKVFHRNLVHQGNDSALRGSAGEIAKRLLGYRSDLDSTVEAIVLAAFREEPTIVFDQERTVEAMREAEEAVPEATTTYEEGKPFLAAGVQLGAEGLELLKAHRAAYLDFMETDDPAARLLRQERLFQRVGIVALVTLLSIGLLVYTRLHQPRIFQVRMRTVAFAVLLLGTLLGARLLDMNWPQIPELVLAPCLLAASVLAIVYPQRFAVGAICIVAVLVTAVVDGSLTFLITLFTAVAVAANQLDEIRSRTKLISAGLVTALAVMIASSASGLVDGHSYRFIVYHALWAGGCALMAAFVVSGLLPFIERAFRVATSLTLLEWRDPTKPLLQHLARSCPGTYNHSLVIGTLAEAACESIGANGLLAQVGSLYHDIGKIPKAQYFAENQEGGISRHDNLAPNMSLLIILGHVKDGVEMAKEYKLPRVLHQFIEEHHGTTVVRYFHHVASEKQPQIASGKHDREVPEAEFRYPGPKPRSRESVAVMLCDGVESAVRALHEPTVGRIESVVHQLVTSRLNDEQLSDCDMTMREIRLVEESLVKSLCAIYHGRVAYPKARKDSEEGADADEPDKTVKHERVSV